MLNSRCSFHVWPDKELLPPIRWSKVEKISWGTKWRVDFGIGIEKVQMHNGIVRVLIGVRHILGLKQNFILLDTLDSKDCEFLASGVTIRAWKWRRVIYEVNKKENLYVLNGSTVRTGAWTVWVPKVCRYMCSYSRWRRWHRVEEISSRWSLRGKLDATIEEYKPNLGGNC